LGLETFAPLDRKRRACGQLPLLHAIFDVVAEAMAGAVWIVA